MTLRLPGSSLKPVAPVTDHDKTEDCPLVIELGAAVNDEITGSGGGGAPFVTVTVTLRVTAPAVLVAVKI